LSTAKSVPCPPFCLKFGINVRVSIDGSAPRPRSAWLTWENLDNACVDNVILLRSADVCFFFDFIASIQVLVTTAAESHSWRPWRLYCKPLLCLGLCGQDPCMRVDHCGEFSSLLGGQVSRWRARRSGSTGSSRFLMGKVFLSWVYSGTFMIRKDVFHQILALGEAWRVNRVITRKREQVSSAWRRCRRCGRRELSALQPKIGEVGTTCGERALAALSVPVGSEIVSRCRRTCKACQRFTPCTRWEGRSGAYAGI